MNYKTQNFTVEEIVHDPRYFNNLTNEELFCAGMMTGTMESIRDYLCFSTGMDIPIIITSGLRRLAQNLEVYRARFKNKELPKSAFTSNHIWRLEKGYIRCGVDFKCKGLHYHKAFELLKNWWTGEIYENQAEQIVHVAYQGKVIKKPWIQ